MTVEKDFTSHIKSIKFASMLIHLRQKCKGMQHKSLSMSLRGIRINVETEDNTGDAEDPEEGPANRYGGAGSSGLLSQ